MGILLLLKMLGSGMLRIISRYWKFIVVALGLLAIAWTSYQYGRSTADLEWTAVHNREVRALNAKIVSIEADSRSAVSELRSGNAELAGRLAVVLANKQRIIPRNFQGNELNCTDTRGIITETVYLSVEFSQRWNDINAEGNR